MAALAMFVMVSCSNKADEVKEIYQDATTQLKKCDGDMEKHKQIIKETHDKVQAVYSEMDASDAAKLAADDEVKEAIEEFIKAGGESAGAAIEKSMDNSQEEMMKKMKEAGLK